MTTRLYRMKTLSWIAPAPCEYKNATDVKNCAILDDANPISLRNIAINYIRQEITNTADAPFCPDDVTYWELLYTDQTYNIFCHDGLLQTRRPSKYSMHIRSMLIEANGVKWLYNFQDKKLTKALIESNGEIANCGAGSVTLYDWCNKRLPERIINKNTISADNDKQWLVHRKGMFISVKWVIKNMFDAKDKEAEQYAEYWISQCVDSLPIEERLKIYVDTDPKRLAHVVSNFKSWRKNI